MHRLCSLRAPPLLTASTRQDSGTSRTLAPGNFSPTDRANLKFISTSHRAGMRLGCPTPNHFFPTRSQIYLKIHGVPTSRRIANVTHASSRSSWRTDSVKGGPGASPGGFRFSGGSTAPARVSLYIPMCSGVRPDQIIVPLYKGAWSDRTTLLSQ